MQKPAKSDSILRSAEEESACEGLRATADEGERFHRALVRAVDYRGDVTLRLCGGEVVVGFAYDLSRKTDGEVLRMVTVEGPRRSIPCANIEEIEFTGRDTASGRSFESWMKKYVTKRLAGERAIEDSPETDSSD